MQLFSFHLQIPISARFRCWDGGGGTTEPPMNKVKYLHLFLFIFNVTKWPTVNPRATIKGPNYWNMSPLPAGGPAKSPVVYPSQQQIARVCDCTQPSCQRTSHSTLLNALHPQSATCSATEDSLLPFTLNIKLSENFLTSQLSSSWFTSPKLIFCWLNINFRSCLALK